MDGNNMNKFTNCTQDIKRYLFPHITQNKATGIGFVSGIIFYDFPRENNMFDFFYGYVSRVTTPLCMSGDYILSVQQLLADLFKHLLLYIIAKEFCQGIYAQAIGWVE